MSLIVGTPVNKLNSRKADNLKHLLWEANVITDIRLSQDSVDINNDNNDNNNNLFIYSELFNMLGDQKCITTINNLKTIQILEICKYI